ncbi:MAG TPA: type VI secretion system tip protein TssI/VgrG [Candidatus Sulfotelmatobacter sp.]|nr:type VI secretion system tip protein TssI/VgrG [Candidatus Sulfotelmatobacter sp.]
MANPTQQNRLLSIDTELGTDKLLLRTVSVTEHMGRLFQIEVEMDSTDSAITFENIVGTSATVTLTMPNGNDRYFNGIVSRFVQEQQGTIPIYRATLSPWLWLLTRSSNCRIFQNVSVPDIIEKIFGDGGFTDYALKLSATYNPKEYCVQYRETDFNFVSRLMEQEGIYYYFEHQDGKHILTLIDSPSQHDTYPGYDTLTYRASSGKDEQKEAVTDWIIEKELQSGMYVMNDFNFTTPKAAVTGNANITRSHENASLTVFDYPGGFGTASDGEAYAKLRIQELQAQYEILSGQASVRGIATGYKFTLKGHPRSDQGRQYLVIGTTLQATTGTYASGGGGSEFFSCGFTAIPATQQYRTPRTTPKPLIRGPQTAIVTGPSGQEIYTDEYGRVCVQFHWDRPDQDDNAQTGSHSTDTSCMIRVAQIWAGKQWGAVYIPRIGQEVVVEFLEGDPDFPIITGCVYNADQMPPQTLPANQTQSGIISRSSTGGSASNFNSLWFEDKQGSEQISIQAEKDMLINIKNNRTETITNNRSLTIKGTDTKEVDGNLTETFKGTQSVTVSSDVTQTYQGALSQTVTKDVTHTFNSGLSITVTNDVTETFNSGHTEQTSETYSLQADTISITGQTKITLTVGGNSITIDSTGIKINSAASLGMQASGQTTIQGATVGINS